MIFVDTCVCVQRAHSGTSRSVMCQSRWGHRLPLQTNVPHSASLSTEKL